MKGSLKYICEASKEMHDTFSRATSDGGLDNTCFSSWCNFGLYDVDFGWGKPIYVGVLCWCNVANNRTVILTDTRSRDGVEAWVYLDEQRHGYSRT